MEQRKSESVCVCVSVCACMLDELIDMGRELLIPV